MKKSIILAAVLGVLLMVAPVWGATTIVEVAGPVTVNSYNTATSGGSGVNAWVINETFTGVAAGDIQLSTDTASSALAAGNPTGSGHTYGKWFTKTVINNTGLKWTSFELELQSVYGQASGEGDGLSFAQGGGLVFSSDQFGTYTRIDITKDYLNFSGGDVLNGESVTFFFAMSDNDSNDTFWLRETPNKVDVGVPEPLTLLLLGLGLTGLAGLRRRFEK